jgi:hypothetical protein
LILLQQTVLCKAAPQIELTLENACILLPICFAAIMNRKNFLKQPSAEQTEALKNGKLPGREIVKFFSFSRIFE